MAYLLISNFQAGLDTRKSAYTAPPGSLRLARNVHLTRGAEIEVRKLFVPVYTLPAGQTKGCTSVRGQLYVFGTAASVAVPSGVNYQRLVAPGSPGLVRILSTDNFNGKIYVVAEFTDGSIYHFYDGARVTEWDAISNGVASNQALATALAARIDILADFTSSATGSVITVTAATANVPFTYSASAVNGGAINDQSITPALIQAAAPAVPAAPATFSFSITGGTANPGVNRVVQITIGGVALLAAPVNWVTSNDATASAVASAANASSQTERWNASVSGNVLTFTATVLGTSRNGLMPVVTVGGDVTHSALTATSGGVNSVPAMAQVVTFTIGGTFEAKDTFTITLDGVVAATLRGDAAGTATFVKTLGQKMYATNQSLMHFTGFTGTPAVPDPTAWASTHTGAGFINMSTQDGGSSQLTGLAVYQNRIAVFSRRNVQIWTVDADPANNKQDQVLANIGTRAPRTLGAFGDIDVFFMSESGVRSLRARDSSNMASTDDVGSAIDGELLAFTHSLDEALVARSVSIAEPFEGRYLLAVGPVVYVFSHFPGAKVSAWTTYDLEELGSDRVVTDWAVTDTQLVARVGDRLCFYGGQSATEYDTAEAFEYEVELPFLDAEIPTAKKAVVGLDVGAEGHWDVYLALDPKNPQVRELLAKLDGSTYGEQGRCAVVGDSTHFSLTLKGRSDGYARLANLAIHFRSHENN
jgi:hypothetical protein